ncbi:f-box domain protein [Fusarium beomiforme]|uniref:F-box domain protein n=1 Tax=Fusarium beomiforme TaxID=44412 RepID=A0A9P5A5M2_9HYPO|nr:f-box domain protein [Fusarium beomiforme]
MVNKLEASIFRLPNEVLSETLGLVIDLERSSYDPYPRFRVRGREWPVASLDSAHHFIEWLSCTTELNISGHAMVNYGVQQPSLSIFISRTLNCLTRLTILRFYGDLISLPSVLEGLADLGNSRPNLPALEIYNIMGSRSDSHWQTLRDCKGTAPIKSLKLDYYGQTPQALEALIRWPKKLQKLWFRPFCAWSTGQSGLFSRWSFAVMQPILETQMANLRELSIPDLDIGGIEDLDFSNFMKLEILKLPSTVTRYRAGDVPRLVAPNLRVFEWRVINGNNECEEEVDDFGQEQEDWVRAFVRRAVDCKTKLETFYIEFSPIMGRVYRNVVYPWDRMDSVARQSEPHGIKIRYSPPTFSKEDLAYWMI